MSNFSRDQLADLRRLGVTAEQLAELQRILPTCRRALQAPLPTMTDVRDQLTGLHKVMQDAATAVSRWESGRVNSPGLVEARARVQLASFDRDHKGTAIADALDAVLLAESVVSDALAGLPNTQRRPDASFFPVHWIHQALLRGWGRVHYPVRTGESPQGNAGAAIPPFPHSPSSGQTSSFRKIVCMVYDAALGTRDKDPERAIKAFMRWHTVKRTRDGR